MVFPHHLTSSPPHHLTTSPPYRLTTPGALLVQLALRRDHLLRFRGQPAAIPRHGVPLLRLQAPAAGEPYPWA
eukprot:scaffold96831_cov24-Phaeocystis_antarctica.AAC.1